MGLANLPDQMEEQMRYQWSQLNKQQAGTYAEYFVKMEFTMHGFQVYTSEVDDRGIDFVCRYQRQQFLEIQVKSFRKPGYVFLRKDKFEPRPELVLALVQLNEGREPTLFLIPSSQWLQPGDLLVGRDYEGLKSRPEWGLNLSRRNLPLLAPYAFDQQIGAIVGGRHVG
jgi:hypothetical protein